MVFIMLLKQIIVLHLFLSLAEALSLSPSPSQPKHASSPSPRAKSNNNFLSFGSILESSINDDHQSNQSSGSWKWQYWCNYCSCGFNKLKSYKQHVEGKRHISALQQADRLWIDYQQSGPLWYHPTVTKDTITRAWSLDLFMNGLQARSRSSIKQVLSSASETHGRQLDPSLRLDDLPLDKRAALWKHLHTSTVPNLPDMIAALPSRYVRIKELLESLEVYEQIFKLMRRSKMHGQKPKRLTHIYDIGCGHGLVGMLCAATFPEITVRSMDLFDEPSDAYQAQRNAFQSTGVGLNNLHYVGGDFTSMDTSKLTSDKNDLNNNGNRLVLCVHGCKSLTHESIEWAQHNHWAWLVLPCCLQAEHHLDPSLSLQVDDSTRFAMLCGAMAAKYYPDTVATLDHRITARSIVLSSSGL